MAEAENIIQKKEKSFSAKIAWTVWFIISTFYGYQYVARVIPTVIMPDLMEKFHLDAGNAGNYNGVYYIGYVLIHIPLGIILDHFSSKKVIPICILLTSLGLLPLVFTESWTLSLIGRLLIGIGSAGAAIGGFKLIRLYFGEERFTRVLGYMVTFGLIIATYGGGSLATSVKLIGWEDTTVMIVGIGVILSILSYLLFPNNVSEESEGFSIKVIFDDLKYIFTRKTMWMISIMGGLLIGVLEGFADAWGVQFLKQVYQLAEETAASINALVTFGMAAGLIILGYLSEKLKSYYGLIIVCAILMLVIFICLLGGYTSNITLLYILFFILGICCAYQLLVIGKAALSASEEHASLTAAVVNMIMMSFGYLFHVSIGKIMKMTWDGTLTANGRHLYKAINYQYSLSVVILGLVLGLIGFVLISFLETIKNSKLKK